MVFFWQLEFELWLQMEPETDCSGNSLGVLIEWAKIFYHLNAELCYQIYSYKIIWTWIRIGRNQNILFWFVRIAAD